MGGTTLPRSGSSRQSNESGTHPAHSTGRPEIVPSIELLGSFRRSVAAAFEHQDACGRIEQPEGGGNPRRAGAHDTHVGRHGFAGGNGSCIEEHESGPDPVQVLVPSEDRFPSTAAIVVVTGSPTSLAASTR